jgi:cobalt transporter subunit CbtB
MHQTQTADLQTTTSAGVKSDVNVVVQAVLAMALGLFVVGVVGFSHINAVHNAAHDVRHSNAFPCH